jgi:hypothetical protein
MRIAFERLVLVGAPLALLAACSTGCVDNNTTIFIRQVQALDVDNSCSVTNDPGATTLLGGVLDTALAGRYDAALLIGNQLVARGNPDTMRTETARVQLYEADTEVFDSSGGTISSFTMPVSGFIDAPSGNDPAYGVAYTTLIEPGTAASLTAVEETVVARIKVYGITLGDIEVETGYWDFPIQVCNGCIACICPASPEDDIVETCNAGQNTAIDCRLHPLCADAPDHCGCSTM